MKRIIVLLCIAAIASAVAAEGVKVAPTKAVVDYLVSRGADPAAIEMAKANAPSEALFLAPGAPSKEALAKILSIVDKPALDTSSPEYVILGYDPHDKLNDVVFSELWKAAAQYGSYFEPITMQIGDNVWSISTNYNAPAAP